MRVALYARVSTQKQEEEHTIESQISATETWIKEKGHILIDKYIDEGYSGTLLARPSLDRLRDDAIKGLFEAVAIHSPDRLARSYVWQEVVIEELKNRGVSVIFLNRPISETAEDKLLLGVQGIFAEYERAKFIERTRRGKLHRAKSGHIIGNLAPYGYSCVKKSQSATGYSYYIVNESEAKTVRLIFNLCANKSMTTYGIITELNRLKMLPRISNRWAKSSVARILRNQTYTGTTFYNKNVSVQSKKSFNEEKVYHRRKNTSLRLKPREEWIAITGVPVIIDEALFQRTQIQLDANEKFSSRNTKLKYLLTGLVKCDLDNRSYYGIPMHGKPYYRCSGKSRLLSDSPCISRSVSAQVLDGVVWLAVKELLNNPKIFMSQILRKQSEIQRQKISDVNIISEIDSKLSKLKLEESRLLTAYSQQIITLDQLKLQNERIRNEESQLLEEKKKVAQYVNQTFTNRETTKSVHLICKRILDGIDSLEFEKKQRFLRKILNDVIIERGEILIHGFIPTASKYQLCPQPLSHRSTRCGENHASTHIPFHITESDP
jgi:site-specific DNA recombinase